MAFGFRLRQALAEPSHVIQPFDQDAWAARLAQQTDQLPFTRFLSGVEKREHRLNIGALPNRHETMLAQAISLPLSLAGAASYVLGT